jgi:hypothetical protein
MGAVRLKIAGVVLVLMALGVLLLFGFGETIGGDISGQQHLLQAAP